MSAGFDVNGETFWGTNGAVETYVELLSVCASGKLGKEHPISRFFKEERDGFFTGKVVFLDSLLKDSDNRSLLVTLLDDATRQIREEGIFTAYGYEWIDTVVVNLRKQLASTGVCGASKETGSKMIRK